MSRRASLALALSPLLLAAACRKTDAVPPEEFSARIGGFPVGAVLVSSKGPTVRYEFNASDPSRESETAVFTPSAEQWAKFNRLIRQAGVRGWDRKYEDSRVLDGTHWGVRIRCGDKTYESEGSNSFPSVRKFELFREAVEELIPGKRFD